MQEHIGRTAGKIWNILNEKGEIDVSRLGRLVGEKAMIGYMAVGWLAREDQVDIVTRGEKVYAMVRQ